MFDLQIDFNIKRNFKSNHFGLLMDPTNRLSSSFLLKVALELSYFINDVLPIGNIFD